jgi:hypothetical protein
VSAAPPDPFTWKDGWVVFDLVAEAPLVFQIANAAESVDRCGLIFQTEGAGIAMVKKLFQNKELGYPDRLVLRRMPRDVESCLVELQERLKLQAFSDGETIWAVRDLQ